VKLFTRRQALVKAGAASAVFAVAPVLARRAAAAITGVERLPPPGRLEQLVLAAEHLAH
jgi:hypothetical protein